MERKYFKNNNSENNNNKKKKTDKYENGEWNRGNVINLLNFFFKTKPAL